MSLMTNMARPSIRHLLRRSSWALGDGSKTAIRPDWRGLATASTTNATAKKEGDISNSFTSLSDQGFKPLDPRFAEIKRRLIAGHEEVVVDSWHRLLDRLREEVPLIATLGSKVIPEIDFSKLESATDHFKAEHRKRGVAIVRQVIPEQDTLQMMSDLKKYIADNPHTKAYPQENPQVYELYWSPAQLNARSHPNMLSTQKFLMDFWHSSDPAAAISSSHPVSYADRLRIRTPGDSKFALGPHIDGGSCERWEPNGYGLGHVYDRIFHGHWEEYDAFESSCRLPVVSDLYNGAGACTAFRMYQGWLSMSETSAFEGTLLVNPLLGLATAYYLLRPMFSPRRAPSNADMGNLDYMSEFLHADNWTLQTPADSWLHGATPGHGQELTAALHPHLSLATSMVHVPKVRPGDYVAWHCDTIHAVDKVHAGSSDSGVLYIPSCPLTEGNARYLFRQRAAFLAGSPGPDFPGGEGESRHVGRWSADDCRERMKSDGLRAFGLESWDSAEEGLLPGQQHVLDRANKILGFYH